MYTHTYTHTHTHTHVFTSTLYHFNAVLEIHLEIQVLICKSKGHTTSVEVFVEVPLNVELQGCFLIEHMPSLKENVKVKF